VLALCAWPWVTGTAAGRHHLRGLAAAILISLRLIGVFDVRFKALRLDRQRNLRLRQTVHHIATKLEKVARIDDVFESIHQFAPAVAASACRGHKSARSRSSIARGLLRTVLRGPLLAGSGNTAGG